VFLLVSLSSPRPSVRPYRRRYCRPRVDVPLDVLIDAPGPTGTIASPSPSPSPSPRLANDLALALITAVAVTDVVVYAVKRDVIADATAFIALVVVLSYALALAAVLAVPDGLVTCRYL